MALQITHETVCQAWELLRTCPPFKRWKLPPHEEIEFHVYKRHNGKSGEYYYLGAVRNSGVRHRIRINTHSVSTLQTLLLILSHEAAHMRQQLEYPKDKAHHGTRFQQYAKQICKHHSWIFEEF